MALTLKNNKSHWLLYFEQLYSTNNYAMEWISDGMAQHGQVVTALHQTNGRGQRNKQWLNDEKDIKMSLILQPEYDLDEVYVFSMLISLAVQYTLEELLPKNNRIQVKWPNDIYINDKKASGILIENVLRGSQWQWAVIGIGLNITDKSSQKEYNGIGLEELIDIPIDPFILIQEIRINILNYLHLYKSSDKILETYQSKMYKIFELQTFENIETQEEFQAYVEGANKNGELILKNQDGVLSYWSHGTVKWML